VSNPLMERELPESLQGLQGEAKSFRATCDQPTRTCKGRKPVPDLLLFM